MTVALATFVMIGGLSIRQITAPSFALPALASGIAAVSDVDRYLADHSAELHESVAGGRTDAVLLRGFPVDVVITPEDLGSESGELRSTVLFRAAARVYEGGSAEFDRTGNQSLELMSGEYVLATLVDRLNGDTHRLMGWLAFVSALAAGGGAAMLILQNGRLPAVLGAAVLVGAAPGVVIACLAWLLGGQYGSGADPYAAEIRSILRAAAGIPVRNFLIAAAAGGLISASVVVSDLLGGRIGRASEREPEAIIG
ncbi:MAG: hypothetical protein ACE5EF_04035 [Dehalococcoidia bacterium]